MDANEKFGLILSTTPPIVESILNNLRMRDLYSCASVCKLWNNIVLTIKKNRKDLFWSLIDYNWCCFAHSENVDDDDKIYSAHPWDIPSPLRVFFHVDLSRASSDPKFALLFCSHQLLTKLQKFVRYARAEPESSEGKSSGTPRKKVKPLYSNKVMDFLSNHLPNTCNTLFCAAQGIVGTPFNKTSPQEVESSPALGGVFFPSLNGVDVYQFPINNVMCLNCLPAVTGIPEDQKVKCLFVFTKSVPHRKGSACRLIDHYLKEQDNDMAVGGAVVDELCCRTSSSKTFSGVGIAFTGDNVKATSVILKENVRTWASAEKQLRRLQSCSVLGDQNCAFMFACVARGSGFYNNSNVEACVFHKLFPSVPLFGVFGNGEIGIEYLPNSSAHKKEKHTKIPAYLHSYTTVFVLLSLKR